MKKFNLIMLSTIIFLIIACAQDTPSELSTADWKEVAIGTEIPANCACSQNKIKDQQEFKTILYNNKLDSSILNQENFNVMVIDTSRKTCTLIIKHGIMVGTSKICNYPDEIKNWDFSAGNGIEVMFSGTEYESCEQISGPPIYTHSDFILSKFLKSTNP
jgi:hypothetical protein